MSYPQYLSGAIENAFIAPLRPESRAAFLQVLADQPGITSLGKATDTLGRTGVALAMVYDESGISLDFAYGQKKEFRAIFDEKTGDLLAYQEGAPGESAGAEQTVIERSGWVDKLGESPQN
jgi:hypothetical protein